MPNPHAKISVCEIFGSTIQGEGAVVGYPTVFIRTGGCDYKCVWCDSLHAVLPEYARTWTKHEAATLYEEVKKLAPRPMMITLSGGNPALQPFDKLFDFMIPDGYEFTCETQGTVSPDWFADLHYLVLSPKPPSSNMVTDWALFEKCIEMGYTRGKFDIQTNVSIKVVVMDDNDYEYAVNVHQRYPQVPFFISVGNDNPPHYSEDDEYNYGSGTFNNESVSSRAEWILNRVVDDGRWVTLPRIIPQVHTLLWGNKQGV